MSPVAWGRATGAERKKTMNKKKGHAHG